MALKTNILLTGVPGIGKTTIICKVCDNLKKNNVPIQGFYTEEVRNDRGMRYGFDIVSLSDGKRMPLARSADFNVSNVKSKYKVGRYSVYVEEFEKFALPLLDDKMSSNSITVIDEIGKMETFSQLFTDQVKKICDNPKNKIFATIPIAKGKPIPIVEELRNNPAFSTIMVTKSNRDELLQSLTENYKNCI